MVSACRQTATSRVEELRIQGLYLPHKGAALPIDVSAHVFFPAPFGKDGGHDAIQASQGRIKVNFFFELSLLTALQSVLFTSPPLLPTHLSSFDPTLREMCLYSVPTFR